MPFELQARPTDPSYRSGLRRGFWVRNEKEHVVSGVPYRERVMHPALERSRADLGETVHLRFVCISAGQKARMPPRTATTGFRVAQATSCSAIFRNAFRASFTRSSWRRCPASCAIGGRSISWAVSVCTHGDAGILDPWAWVLRLRPCEFACSLSKMGVASGRCRRRDRALLRAGTRGGDARRWRRGSSVRGTQTRGVCGGRSFSMPGCREPKPSRARRNKVHPRRPVRYNRLAGADRVAARVRCMR